MPHKREYNGMPLIFESAALEVYAKDTRALIVHEDGMAGMVPMQKREAIRAARAILQHFGMPAHVVPKRMWVNQPSTLQPEHALHGTRVLAVHEYDNTYRVYFLDGLTESRQMLKLSLSDGWPQHLMPPEGK